MAEEALSCFQNLIKSIPEWIAEIKDIVESSTQRQRQMLLDNQTSGHNDQAPRLRRKASRTSSVEAEGMSEEARKSLEVLRPQLPHLTDSDALRLSQRKRKTASVTSGDNSGPPKYRNQSLIVIYYDGDVQKRFEKLVRSVAGSRNDIRKSKLGTRVDALSRTGSSSSDNSNSGDEEFSPLSIKYQYKRSTRSALTTFGRDDGTAAFDRVDTRLERGQTLCERAAHQVLRDGDCNNEVAKILVSFKEALDFAQQELPAVQRRAEKASLRRKRSQERRHGEKDDRENASIVLNAMPPGEAHLEVDPLEVDDANSDEDYANEFNINSFQMGKLPSFRRDLPPVNRHMARHALS